MIITAAALVQLGNVQKGFLLVVTMRHDEPVSK
jgi:hypothetical protein